MKINFIIKILSTSQKPQKCLLLSIHNKKSITITFEKAMSNNWFLMYLICDVNNNTLSKQDKNIHVGIQNNSIDHFMQVKNICKCTTQL